MNFELVDLFLGSVAVAVAKTAELADDMSESLAQIPNADRVLLTQ